MSGEVPMSPLKHSLKDRALNAFERGEEGAAQLLEQALAEGPNDGPLLIAHAAALFRAGAPEPFARLETMLEKAPDWVEGHKALCRLRAEARAPNPLASIEAALEKAPKSPRLWMAYLTLLGSAGRHEEAAEHTANLRKTIADLPELRLVEARHRGFAKQFEQAQRLLVDLPAGLPELEFERARNAMRMGKLDSASAALETVLKEHPKDIGAWALAELTWRASDNSRHSWLCPSDALFTQADLGLSQGELDTLRDTLRALHVTRSAPLGQSVEGGTQTHGNLRLRHDPAISHLFEAIDAAIADYSSGLPKLPEGHPMAAIQSRRPQISASWSILLSKGGRHVPHLHDGGLISSAAHISIPDDLAKNEGLLELGRPPEDIPLKVEPISSFAPKPGHLVLFPSFVYHSTSRFAEGERLTVAFDAV
ncbi:hypothetical protein EH31_01825 [Erythrobacter longus]|uniref:Tetratricopeptide repeat protein n=1 Tax=Erythrobacter longus TaxID=1044 RepID=A0A074MHT6_ERYLO|nr:putative 2OG-Fe(II) oxygenase [Erythrobacter longus]KEO91428.1 hypothetical protein EH31_01825 [Erythrobacter longus]